MLGLKAIAIVVLTAVGQAQSAEPRFEIASVKPNSSGSLRSSQRAVAGGFIATNVLLIDVIRFSYTLEDYQLQGGPAWIRSDRFDINAKAPTIVPLTDMQAMVRALLADRFKLKLRTDVRESDGLILTLARADGRLGPNLRPTAANCQDATTVADPSSRTDEPVVPVGGARLRGACETSQGIAASLGRQLAVPVMDKTGLAGNWNFTITYAPDPGRLQSLFPGAPPPPDNPDMPFLRTAVQEQLGLRFESARIPTRVMVIDSVDPPTPD